MTSLRPFLLVVLITPVVFLSSIEYLESQGNKTELPGDTRVILSKFQCYTPPNFKNKIPLENAILDALEIKGDTSLPKLNKKFLVVLHMTQDSLGNSPLSDAELLQTKNDLKSASGYYSSIKMSFEANDSVYIIENHRFDVIETVDELNELSQLYAKPNRINPLK